MTRAVMAATTLLVLLAVTSCSPPPLSDEAAEATAVFVTSITAEGQPIWGRMYWPNGDEGQAKVSYISQVDHRFYDCTYTFTHRRIGWVMTHRQYSTPDYSIIRDEPMYAPVMEPVGPRGTLGEAVAQSATLAYCNEWARYLQGYDVVTGWRSLRQAAPGHMVATVDVERHVRDTGEVIPRIYLFEFEHRPDGWVMYEPHVEGEPSDRSTAYRIH